MSRGPIPVFVCDPQPATLHGLTAILEAADGIDLIGSVPTAEACLARPCENDSVVYVVDRVSRAVNDTNLIKQLIAVDSTRRVIVYSAYDHIALIANAYFAGASAFVSKLDPPNALLDAIAAVAQLHQRRQRHYPGQLAVAIADFYADGGAAESPRRLLTNRQLEIFIRLADGHALNDIAEALNIDPRTVSNQLVKIRRQLDVPREYFRSHAIAHGLINPSRSSFDPP